MRKPLLHLLIKESRIQLGMSQAELARESGISYPAIQVIESGKGNPSYTTLQALFEALGIQLRIEVKRADWDLLAACGAPLTTSAGTTPSKTVNAKTLVRGIREACLELASKSEIEDRPRKKEALEALLLALSLHYPSFYSRHFKRSLLIRNFVPTNLTGTHIKLKRQASARLAEYL